jgi:tol-pal system protein YbgF
MKKIFAIALLASISYPALANDSILADLGVRMMEMEDRIRTLNGRIEELEFQNRTINEQMQAQKTLNEQLSQKIQQQSQVAQPQAPVNDAFSVIDNASQTQPDIVVTPPTPPLVPAPTQTQGVAPASSATLQIPTPTQNSATNSANLAEIENVSAASSEYSIAFAALSSGDYDSARALFQTFVEKYPTDQLTGNAYYWLGETYYVISDFENASIAFRNGFQKDKEGLKAADNLLKLAMSLSRMNMQKEACSIFKEIPKAVPNAQPTILQRVQTEMNKIGC